MAKGLQCLAPMHESPLAPQAGLPGHFINVLHCGGLCMVPLQLKDPLELLIKRSEFVRGSLFLSHCVMT